MTAHNTKSRIASGFYRVIERLGGMSDTLSIAGSYGDTLTDEQVADELEAWLAANPLRPQPSGETREQMMGGGDVIALVDQSRWDCPNAPQLSYANGWNDAVSAHPLALGGQHSTATDFPPDDVLACVGDTTPARAEAQDEDTPCTDCGDTGVTHQTERRCSCQEAEAQDEGATEERERIARIISPSAFWLETASHNTVFQSDCLPVAREKAFAKADEIIALHAHPSPTPAADADRVRIAVEALERIKSRKQTCASDEVEAWELQDIAAEALAALKSTAAKEGGGS